MPKYLIKWDAGYGENYEVIEAGSEHEAQNEAYEAWREEAENNADYSARPLTKEIADDYGIDFDD